MNIRQLAKIYSSHNSFLVLIFSLFLNFEGYGQNAIAPSLYATGQSLGHTGSLPQVEHSTGIMSYGIPLFNLEGRDANLSIALNYRASGIKTDQQSSSVGIGWSLSTVGVISRTVRGLPDNSNLGRLILPHPTGVSGYNEVFLQELSKGLRDGESDMFQLNYGVLNVKFFLERVNGPTIKYKAVLLTKSHVKIDIESVGLDIEGFRVIDENGNVYIFREKEEVVAHVDGHSSSYSGRNNGFVSSWYLSEIESYTGERIFFEYTSDVYSFYTIQTTAKELIYGTKWILYGQDSVLRQEYGQLVNQYTNDQERRRTMMNHIRDLEATQTYYIHQRYANAVGSVGQSLALGYFYHSIITGIRDQISNYERQIFDLGPPISYGQLENKLQQLANTSTEIASIPIRIPRISVSRSKFVKSIRLKNSRYEFDYYTINAVNGYPRSLLNRIRKVDNMHNVLEEVRLGYSTSNTTNDLRPFLKTLTIVGDSTISSDDFVYHFDYHNESLVYKKESRDYWGFYNGVNLTGDNYFPDIYGSVYINEIDSWREHVLFRNQHSAVASILLPSNRVRSFEPDGSFAKTHSLKKVKLPLGGEYEFEYEGNRALTYPYIDDYIVSTSLEFGGIRICKIKGRDDKGYFIPERTYIYDFNPEGTMDTVSSGIYVKKNYQTFSLGLRYEDNIPDVVISSEPFDMSCQFEPSGNENIFYTYVEEHTVGKGYEGYHYLPFNPKDSVYPYWLEGVLLSKTCYDEQRRLLSQQKYRYQADQDDVLPYLMDNSYTSRFVHNNDNGYSRYLKQYKPFPYQMGIATDVTLYPNTTDPRNFYNAYQMVYEPNILPRRNPKLDSLTYYIHYGGSILLNDIEEWSAQGRMDTIILNPGNALFVFNAEHGPGITTKTSYRYGNAIHSWPTEIEKFESNGDRSLVKTKRVIDYSPGTAVYIDSLQHHNRLLETVEIQKWILRNGESNWKLAEGNQSIYSPYLLSSKNGYRERNVYLPSLLYRTALPHVAAPGELNWNETVSSSSPYSTVGYGQGTAYSPETWNYWKSGINGVQNIGSSHYSGIGKAAKLQNYLDLLEVEGADGDEVLLLPRLNGRSVKKKTTNYTHIGNIYYGDQIEFLAYLRQRMVNLNITNGGYIFPKNLLVTLDTALRMIGEGNFSTELKQTVIRQKNLVDSVWNDSNKRFQFDTFVQPYTSFEEVYHISQVLYNNFSNGIPLDNMFSRTNDIVNETGSVTVSMPLSKYIASGRRLQFNTVMGIATQQVRFTYNDATPVYELLISLTGSPNGFRTGYVDLSVIPNHGNLKDIELALEGDRQLFIIPEGKPFMLRLLDARGNLVEERSSRGDLITYGYDSQGRLIWSKDRDGNLLNNMKYNIGRD